MLSCTANAAPASGVAIAVRRRDRDALVRHEADRRAIRAQHVHGRLDEPLQHRARIQLERDLLAERPHPLQHAMRLRELLRAQRHALLENSGELPLRQRDVLEHDRRAVLREERVSGRSASSAPKMRSVTPTLVLGAPPNATEAPLHDAIRIAATIEKARTLADSLAYIGDSRDSPSGCCARGVTA